MARQANLARMRALLAFGLIAILALAGCSSNSTTSSSPTSAHPTTSAAGSTSHPASSGPPTTTPDTSGPVPSSPPSSSNATGTNHPPKATLTVIVTGANATFKADGADADGDSLTGTVSFGDGSANATVAKFPASLTHAYKPGNFTAVLTVKDGKASGTSSVKVAVAGAAGTKVTISGTTKISGNPGMIAPVGANACAGYNAGQNEVDCVFGAFDATLAGKAYKATSTGSSVGVEFWDTCDAVMGAYVSGGDDTADEETGKIPAGAGCVILWAYGADPTGATLTITIG